LMLWIFSYLYVFLDFSTADGWLPQLATVGGFAALFMLYMSKPPYKWIRLAGALLSIVLIIAGVLFFDEKITIYRSGIIIFLLSFIYLFGALIWFYTRDNLKLRFIVFLLILLFASVTMHFSLPVKLYAIKEVRWFFNIEYIYFLLILLPATYVGDILKGRVSLPGGFDSLERATANLFTRIMMFAYLLMFVIWMMIALYTEWSLYKMLFSVSAALIIWLLSKRVFPQYAQISLIASVMITGGGLFLFYEGAITKVPCTVSYCLFTTGISIYLLIISDFVVHWFPASYFSRIFSGAGSNPLMSYITFGALVMPVFKLTGLIHIYIAAYPQGWPWIGVARAAVAVIFTMALVAYLSEKRIFWRA
ncbi:MAG: DUF5009 domain-containing protein, partial [Bacteroidales bacterium]|nr:DUF5009 domain-containing protein [Bacteroidales bacterium]MBP9584627.1 DUF5009 domain-containing protein [Bacteroidales bacterium]